jgi:hypothetical protein
VGVERLCGAYKLNLFSQLDFPRADRWILGSKIVNRRGEGIVRTSCWELLVLWPAGRYIFTFFGAGRVTGLNIYSVFVAGGIPDFSF